MAIFLAFVWFVFWLSSSSAKISQKFRKQTVVVYSLILTGAILAAILFRVLFFSVFMIPSGSMERTIIPGDKIWVNKLVYGPRLPYSPYEIPWVNILFWLAEDKKPDVEKGWWGYKRLKGYRQPDRGDVAVFNHPKSKDIFIKRITAIPGDTLSINNGRVVVNQVVQKDAPYVTYFARVEHDNYNLVRHLLDSLNIKTHKRMHSDHLNGYMTRKEMELLSNCRSVISAEIEPLRPDTAWRVYPKRKQILWNIDNYGPFVIPQKGMQITLNRHTVLLYQQIIKQFEGVEIKESGNHFAVNDIPFETYTFTRNYYFVMGDNRHDSQDSRYFGPVPESELIGKAPSLFFLQIMEDLMHPEYSKHLIIKVEWWLFQPTFEIMTVDHFKRGIGIIG
ncbi:signal peptidase I [Geofilum rubicundum]|nr:signal peptidase I [Geofilum rubicundum]